MDKSYLSKKLQRVLANMRQRCNDPNSEYYHYYGGRGIKVCDRWADATRVSMGGTGNNPSQGLLNFIEDMGPSWFDGATIDRIDNNGDYTPENCQWLSSIENSRKAHIGSKRSDETRRKIGESLKGQKRKPLSDETRQKMSEAKQGRKRKPFSDEHRRKLSEARKGRTISEETRRKISETLKGRTLSKEHRRTIGKYYVNHF